MGAYWCSQAELVTTEPKIVKNLILQIASKKETTSVHNLEIKGNSIFFDSDGYGCFGVEWENYGKGLLFKKLFEKYTGALICFEAVNQYQDLGYLFSSIWIKPEGEFNWDDDEEIDETTETFYKKTRVLWIEGDVSEQPCEGRFDEADIWYITFDYLEQNKEDMPNLYAAYRKAKAEGFDDWPISFIDKKKVISCEITQQIGELCSDNQDAVIEEFLENMRQLNSYQIDAEYADFEFKLPENFLKLSKL